jgi:hypothetical protein
MDICGVVGYFRVSHLCLSKFELSIDESRIVVIITRQMMYLVCQSVILDKCGTNERKCIRVTLLPYRSTWIPIMENGPINGRPYQVIQVAQLERPTK